MEISLTAGMRASVLSLQDNASLFDATQIRLSTGKAVNSALDDPTKYFAAQNNTSRASGLSGLKSDMNEALQLVKSADNGISGMVLLLKSAKGIATAAKSLTDTTALASQLTSYVNILTQVNKMAQDSNYKGKDLLANAGLTAADSLTVNFSTTDTNSKITVAGVYSSVVTLAIKSGGTISTEATTGTVTAGATGGWATAANIDTDIATIDTALSTLQTTSATFSANLSVIQARIDFTANMVNVLSQGADKLTLADMNKESANMLALQTQQALATNSLRLASQASQGVLRLFS
ncbi:MAG: flagellin [Nitrospirae bacterium]|nr:flagellin [Nitrospirota bacterium]